MRFLWIFCVLIIEVTNFIIIKKVQVNFNPIFGTGVASIETLANGMTTVNFEGNLTRTLNGKFQFTPQILILEGKKKVKKSVMRMPTINYCDMMRGQMMPMHMIQKFVDQLSEFGRVTVPCPMQPGHYYLKNLLVDETQLPMYRLMPEGLVIVLELIAKQEIASKMVKVFDFEAHYMCNRTNWPK